MAVYELTLPLDDATVGSSRRHYLFEWQVCTAREALLTTGNAADSPTPASLSPKTFAAVRFFMPSSHERMLRKWYWRHWTDDFYSYGTAMPTS